MYRMAVLIGLVLVAGLAQAQDNATINQAGNGNEAAIVQLSGDLSLLATIDQPGNENFGAIIQLGGYDNVATLTQGANGGEALILQEGGNGNTASVTQNAPGWDNDMFVWQEYGTGNTATAVQSGNDNEGSIKQVDGSNNSASLTQNGNGNGQDVDAMSLPTQAAGVSQAEYLTGVCFGEWSIYQCGYDLTATTDVTGNCNSTFQYQEGQGHVASITIVGNENTAFQAQCGCEPTTSTITIAGNGNCVGQFQWGGSVSTIERHRQLQHRYCRFGHLLRLIHIVGTGACSATRRSRLTGTRRPLRDT